MALFQKILFSCLILSSFLSPRIDGATEKSIIETNSSEGSGKDSTASSSDSSDSSDSEMTKFKEDMQKCLKIAKKACADSEEDLVTCMTKTQRRSFPSFCMEVATKVSSFSISALKEKVESFQKKMESISPYAKSCQDSLRASCKSLSPSSMESGEDSSAYETRLKAYQECVKKSLEKNSSCQGMVEELKKNKGKSKSLESLFQNIL